MSHSKSDVLASWSIILALLHCTYIVGYAEHNAAQAVMHCLLVSASTCIDVDIDIHCVAPCIVGESQ